MDMSLATNDVTRAISQPAQQTSAPPAPTPDIEDTSPQCRRHSLTSIAESNSKNRYGLW